MDSVTAAFDKIETIVSRLEEMKEDKDNAPSEGLEFLEAKTELNLNYLVNLSYYMILKTCPGTPLPDVFIEQLFKMRWLLQRSKPLDQKMQYSIDKLLKLSQNPETTVATAKPGKLRQSVTEDVPVDGEENDVTNEGDDIYKAPKFAAAEIRDKVSGEDRLEKLVERKRKRFEQGELMRSLREEFVDAPEEVGTAGNDIRGSKELEVLQRKQNDRIRHEEENFTRLLVKKKDKKEMKRLKELQQKSTSAGVASFQDIANVDNLVRQDRRLSELEDARAQLKRKRGAERPVEMSRDGTGREAGSGKPKKKKRK